MRKPFPSEPVAADIATPRLVQGEMVPRKVAAAFLGRDCQTLANWASMRVGPMPRKPRGRVLYRLADLRAWRDHGQREARHG